MERERETEKEKERKREGEIVPHVSSKLRNRKFSEA